MSTNVFVYEGLLKLIFITAKAWNKSNILCQEMSLIKKKNKYYTMPGDNELQIPPTIWIKLKNILLEASLKRTCIYESIITLSWISTTTGKLIICVWNQNSAFLWWLIGVDEEEERETAKTETVA